MAAQVAARRPNRDESAPAASGPDPAPNISVESLALVTAVSYEMVEEVEALLAKGADANTLAPDGYTVLCRAAEHNDSRIAELLVREGASVELASKGGYSPLICAAFAGSTSAIELLASKGAELDHRSERGGTALIAAVLQSKLEAVNLLLSLGADPTLGKPNCSGLLAIAVERGNTPIIDALYAVVIKHPEAAEQLGQALFAAADLEHYALVKKILRSRNVEEIVEQYGEPALLAASVRNSDHIVEMLLEAGVPVNSRSRCGETALMHAVTTRGLGTVEILLKYDADVDATDSQGRSPLMKAAELGFTSIVDLLLPITKELNRQTAKGGWSALMLAAREGHSEIVEAFIARGADTGLKDYNGDTAASLARQRGHMFLANTISAAQRRAEMKRTVLQR